MKKTDLIKLVHQVINEDKSFTTLNEKPEGKTCNCPVGSEPGDSNFSYIGINCNPKRDCASCCKTIQDALDKGKGGDEMTVPTYNAGGMEDAEDYGKGEIDPTTGTGPTNPDDRDTLKENKMKKTQLLERFQKLAGIKPLYETNIATKEELLNEGPELWTALGGLMGVIGAAGITTQLQMMAEDPAMAEKYPKLAKVFEMLSKIGGAVGSGIKEEKSEETTSTDERLSGFSKRSDTKEELMNEGPELWTALGGVVGVLGTAGIVSSIEMMLDDPAMAEKYPKLVKVFEFLAKVGGALGKGIK
tara:strand:- start:1468 stop:2373 length:906 start_codon:yes stop_codon:yes gene_type:complete